MVPVSGKGHSEVFKFKADKQVVEHCHSVPGIATLLDITTHSLYGWIKNDGLAPLPIRTVRCSGRDPASSEGTEAVTNRRDKRITQDIVPSTLLMAVWRAIFKNTFRLILSWAVNRQTMSGSRS